MTTQSTRLATFAVGDNNRCHLELIDNIDIVVRAHTKQSHSAFLLYCAETMIHSVSNMASLNRCIDRALFRAFEGLDSIS